MKRTVRRTRKTKREINQQIINDYIREHGDKPWDHKDVARWAINNNRWSRDRISLIQLCAKELSQAAREEYYTDPQGRRVRKKHACGYVENGRQRYLWADIESAPPEHMKVSLQQRRRSTLGDLKQLKIDQDSYNENNKHGAQIQLSFDFTEDLAEMEHPTSYPGLESSED